MLCLCGHPQHDGPCPVGIWEMEDGSQMWGCSCPEFHPAIPEPVEDE